MGIPTLKVNLLPTFPANVVGGAGISVNRTNAVYTIGLNYPGLSKISDVAPSEKPNTFVAVYDAPLNQYFTISFSDLTALISLPPPLSAIAGLSPAANTIAYYTGASTAALTSFNAFGRSVVGLTTANNGVMVTDGSGNPSISPALPAAVQANITTVGTITSGIWNGTAIANANLATMPTLTIKSNLTGGTAAPSDNTVSAILDSISSTRGTVLYRGSATWAALAPGTLGTVLTSNGAGADPSYQAVGAGGNMANLTIRSNISGSTAPQADNTLTNIIDASFAASARGTILYRGASGWTALPPGTSGNVLTTNGPGADPAYVAFGINGPMAPLTIKSNITGSAATPADNSLNAVIAATGAIAIPDTTASSSTTTGALKVTGGVGVGGALNQGGDHTITKASPAITLNDTGTGITRLASQRSGFSRWNLQLNDGALESTGNAGSNFAISRFADNGALIDTPLTINRASGQTTLTQASGAPGLLLTSAGNVTPMLNSVSGFAGFFGQHNGLTRWALYLNEGSPESGSNSGSNFAIARYNDAGTGIDFPFNINRASGQATFSAPALLKGATASIASGYVGELLVFNSTGTVNVPSSAVTAMLSASIPAGNWDVWGWAGGNNGTPGTSFTFGISGVSGSFSGGYWFALTIPNDTACAAQTPIFPLASGTSTTIYINGFTAGAGTLAFAAGNVTIFARRRA